jgi:hypothetical protein
MLLPRSARVADAGDGSALGLGGAARHLRFQPPALLQLVFTPIMARCPPARHNVGRSPGSSLARICAVSSGTRGLLIITHANHLHTATRATVPGELYY